MNVKVSSIVDLAGGSFLKRRSGHPIPLSATGGVSLDAMPLKWPVPVAESSQRVGLAWLSQFARSILRGRSSCLLQRHDLDCGKTRGEGDKRHDAIVQVNNGRTLCLFTASERSRLPVPASTILTRSTVAATIGGYSQTPQADRR